MSKVSTLVRSFVREESGATMTEYGIMVALIAAIAVAVITNVGKKVNNGFANVNASGF
jgi:pilus assembly protein Flp/PilA